MNRASDRSAHSCLRLVNQEEAAQGCAQVHAEGMAATQKEPERNIFHLAAVPLYLTAEGNIAAIS